MKTVEVKTYEFSELSEEAKQVAINYVRDNNWYTEDNWYEFVIEDQKERIKAIGFEVDQIFFSGFSSQGDGAMFTGSFSVKNIKNLVYTPRIQKLLDSGKLELNGEIRHIGRYYHSNSSQFIYNDNLEDSRENLAIYLHEIKKQIYALYTTICNDVYKDLESTYNTFNSDAYITEELNAEERSYLENGKMFTL